MFVWRLILEKIATCEALHRRGVLTSVRDLCCVFCFKETETISHLFCTCVMTKEIWNRILAWMGTDMLCNIKLVTNFMHFGEIFKGKKRKGIKHLIWIAVVWNIWSARNKILFKGVVVTVKYFIMSVIYTAWGWFKARRGRNCGVVLSDWINCPMAYLLSM